LEVLRNYLSDYPKSNDIRLQYARALLNQKQYQLARTQFQLLADAMPDNAEMIFAVALISLQLNDFQDAEAQLKQALDKGEKQQDAIQYYLGQLNEARKDEQQALEHYREVKGGEYQFAAQTRVAFLLSKTGQLAEAQQYLHQLQPENNQQRVQLLVIEAQLLREANQQPEAYQVLQQGLKEMPDQTELLYETALLADTLGKPDEFERLIRKLILINPNHAHAYNALGYSLLGRNERLAEAMGLVEKALQLAPNDPSIMDSVGWGYYRTGKLDDSIKILRRAYALNPDPEIAAHLGEVLWVTGNGQEATQIWQNGLKANPDNVPLQEVIKKFKP
jgi:tetratricopeptide (TPR) repeat protein